MTHNAGMTPLPPVTKKGRIWAAVSYGSHFLGLPLGIIPLLLRDDPYAVHHARHAVAVYFGTVVIGILVSLVTAPIAFCTFGLSFFVMIPGLILLAVWPIVHAVHGLILSLTDSWDEPFGTFGLGEKLFGNVRADGYHQATYTAQQPPPTNQGAPQPPRQDNDSHTIEARPIEAKWIEK